MYMKNSITSRVTKFQKSCLGLKLKLRLCKSLKLTFLGN